MRVGLDATPLLGTRTGIGRYVAGLLTGLGELDDAPDVVLTAFSWRGREPLHGFLGTHASVAGRRAPARALHALWARSELPPVEWLSGPVDVFHGTNFVLPPARRAAGVVTVHDLSYLSVPETVAPAVARYRRLVPAAIARAGAVCTPTDTVASLLRHHYDVPPGHVVVTPLGVDAQWRAARPFDAAERAARRLPEQFVLFVGGTQPRKNLPALLAAYADLRIRRVDVLPLVVAGPGHAQQRTTTPATGAEYRAVGFLPDDELRRYVASAAVLAFPSLDEGFGLPPLEAMATGTPVVANDLPVLREVLGAHASFAPAHDPRALAEALVATVQEADDATARAARAAHAASYTWLRCARRTLDAYRLALTAAGPS